jgi:integrase
LHTSDGPDHKEATLLMADQNPTVRGRGNRPATGIRKRHSKGCLGVAGERCTCSAGYEASIYLKREDRKLRRTFERLGEAKAWRAEMTAASSRGEIRTPTKRTVREAGETLLEGMASGAIRDRSGRPYKPATIRSYRRSLVERVYPEYGPLQLAEIRRSDLRDYIGRLLVKGLAASTIRNTLDPLRVIFREALEDDATGIAINPTASLRLPSGRKKRDRVASPTEAADLLVALPDGDRALWATAFYAGLRRGELRALRWVDVNLGSSEISVERSWDQVEGPLDPKSDAGQRTIPILGALRDHLLEHKLATSREGADLVFGRTAALPFVPSSTRNRAIASWDAANAGEEKRVEESGGEPALFEPIGLHEARHTFASLLIDAGVNAKAVQEFMGHSTITMTFDTYGHLMPGSREEVRARMDAYLEASLV